MEGRLKWELHTEFLSLTYTTAPAHGCSPPPAFVRLREEFHGQTVTAIRDDCQKRERRKFRAEAGRDLRRVGVGGGDAEVHSDFR